MKRTLSFDEWWVNNPIWTMVFVLAICSSIVVIQVVREAKKKSKGKGRPSKEIIKDYLPGDIAIGILSTIIVPMLLSTLSNARQELDRVQTMQALFITAHEYNEEKNYSVAVQKWKELIDFDENNAIYHEGYAEALYGLKKMQESEEEFKRAIELNDSATCRNSLGNLYYNSEKYRQAVLEYSKAIELAPEVLYQYENKALGLLKLKRYDKVIETVQEELEILSSSGGSDNNYFRAYYYLGQANDGLNNADSALYYLEQAQSYKPEDKNIINWISLENARKEAEASPHSNSALNNLGNALFSMERYKEAEEEYKKAIAIKEDTVYFANLAATERKLGRLDDAINTLQSAHIGESGNTLAGKRKKAFELEKQALQEPNNSEISIKLGRALYEAEYYLDSREIFESLRKEDPSDTLYKQYIQLLTAKDEALKKSSDFGSRKDLCIKLFELDMQDECEKELNLLMGESELPIDTLAWCYNLFGCIYDRKGDQTTSGNESYIKSVQYFKKAAELCPDVQAYDDNAQIVNDKIKKRG